MSDGTAPPAGGRYAPFNVVALYASRGEADAAAAALRTAGAPVGGVENVDRTSPMWAVLAGNVAGRDEELLSKTGRRILVGVAIGAVIGLVVGVVIALIVHAASDSGSTAVAVIVGGLVGLAIGAILGGFYSGATSLPRSESRSTIGPNAAAIAVHADDADSMAEIVLQLEKTSPQRLAHFGPDGRPQPTRDSRPS
jgi:hypothetical protein